MSLVVAIKDKDRFVFGADKQGTMGNTKDHSCTKVWNVLGYEGCIMGGVGYARANQIMQYVNGLIDKNLLDERGIDEAFVVTFIVPTLVATISEYGISTKLKDDEAGMEMTCCPNTFLFAYKDKGFIINNDLSVHEIDDYVAIGSGAEVAKGVLYATVDSDPFKRISMAIDAASLETLYVDESVEFVVTDLLESDEDNLRKALDLYPEPELDIIKSEELEEKPKRVRKSK